MLEEKGGLTARQAEEKKKNGQANIPVDPPSKSIGQIMAGNIFTYFNLIFAVLAGLLVMVGSIRDLTFVPVIVSNTLIGIIQEIRSKRVLDKINMLNAPRASVIRDGRKQVVNADELVEGDWVVFEAGNQICADAVVLEGSVWVNESLLTGEADEITKTEQSELMSGSFVVSGSCVARLTRVGRESYISRLTLEAKAMKGKRQSEMMRSLDALVKGIGLILIPVGCLLFAQHHFLIGEPVKESVVAVVAALVGMIPEGLYLLASVALVVSVMRLARQKVLVHEMSCIETLARVNVLCVDKTGTITENEMQVSGCEVFDDSPCGEEEFRLLLGDYVSNMSKDNATMAALMKAFRENTGKKADAVIGFSSSVKYGGASMDGKAYVLGAPEFVLREQFEACREKIERYSRQGRRVLAFAIYDGEIDGGELTRPVLPIGMVILHNPVRREAAETFRYFESQGVEIKVISGDNPMTVSNVATAAGIAGASRYVDAASLTTEADIERAAMEYAVFGRVTPNQKRALVKALKKAGKTVAMTGDGVNDVLALKDADCSVAMASGSEAAANAAQIVLLDSNFACMPSVVLEGRRVVNNIQRSASLFLIKNIFSVTMALLVILCGRIYPLKPTQLSLLGAFTIGTPAFFLALWPNKSIIRGHFLVNVLLKAMPAGLTDFVMVASLLFMQDFLCLSEDGLSTIAIFVMMAVGLASLSRICYPFDRFRLLLCVAMTGGLILGVLFFCELFAITVLSLRGYGIAALFGAAAIGVLALMSLLLERGKKKLAAKSRRFRKAMGECP